MISGQRKLVNRVESNRTIQICANNINDFYNDLSSDSDSDIDDNLDKLKSLFSS